MTKEDEDKLSHHINFRLAHDTYLEIMEFLKETSESISKFMREATYNYLKLKQKFEKME